MPITETMICAQQTYITNNMCRQRKQSITVAAAKMANQTGANGRAAQFGVEITHPKVHICGT